MDYKELDVLVVAPHPDDAELGMGGGILSMLASGQRVGVLDLTDGEPTPYGTPEQRAIETDAATDVLGLTWRGNLGLENRKLQPTLTARAALAAAIRQTRPRWLFAPFWEDAHPDHRAATELIEDARFWAKLSKTDMPGAPHHPERIFYYYCVHLKMHAQPAFVLDISEHWERKRKSIESYHSQFILGRESMKPGFVEQQEYEARHWGKSIGVEFGEPYASREPVGLSQLNALL